MRFFEILTAVAIVAGLAGTSQTVPARDQGVWSQEARLGEQRTEAAVVFLNGKIYVLGGMARGQDSHALNQEYDPATDRWRERAPMPHALSHAGAAALNGKIYVVGGFLRNVHLDAQSLAFEYDPAADTWRTLAPMKNPRGAVGVVALTGKIHAIGGRDVNRVTVATHEVYDPATGKWSELAPLPKARDHLAAIASDGRIHVIGGRFDASTDNTGLHDVYDPAVTPPWTSAAPLLTPRSGMAAVLYRGRILTFGGECNNGKLFVENEGFDVKTGRWSRLAPMSSPRHGIQAATDGRVVYIPGGAPACGTGVSDTLQTFRLP
jgi:N-acetylneuraminic acid mutarotase